MRILKRFAIFHKIFPHNRGTISGLTRKLVVASAISLILLVGYVAVYASPDSETVTDTFDTEELIASKTNITVCGGQVKLAEETFTTITECNCNSLDGWYWYETNGREACWSKMLADSVSWNKGVGSNTKDPGAYTCATDVTALSDRMRAASGGEWYKIVSDVAGTTITSSHNGQSGASVISALAISDCIDGIRDLCTGDDCLGPDITAINTATRAWAEATNSKSALPYCSDLLCDTTVRNDYRSACEQTPHQDLPLNCSQDWIFYMNRKACLDTDSNYTWSAAVSHVAYARGLGYTSCSTVLPNTSNATVVNYGFRSVVRP
jgi:hypothetical protein